MILNYKTPATYCWMIFALIILATLKTYPAVEKTVPQYTFVVTVDWVYQQPKDSLFLFLEDDYYSVTQDNIYSPVWSKNHQTRFVVHTAVKRGRFYIKRKTPPGHLNYGTLYKYLPLVRSYCWDADDDVTLTLIRKWPDAEKSDHFATDYWILFSGKGSAKYIASQRIEAIESSITPLKDDIVDTIFYRYQNRYTNTVRVALAEVENHRNQISEFYYHLYRAKVVADIGNHYHFQLQHVFDKKMSNASPEQREQFRQSYFTDEKKLDTLFRSIPDSVAIQSRGYVNFLYKKIRFHYYLTSGNNASKEIVNHIINTYKGDLKDMLLVACLQYDSGSGMAELLFKDSFNLIRNPECIKELDRIAAKMPSYPAYNFKLQDAKGNFVQLSDLKGNVIFVDFWFTGCGACEGYYQKTLKAAEEQLKGKSNIKFVSISIDRSKAYWIKSIQTGNYTSDLAINLYTNGEGTENDVTRYYKLQAFPQFMIVDSSGKLHRFYRDFTSPDISTTVAVVETLSALANTSETP